MRVEREVDRGSAGAIFLLLTGWVDVFKAVSAPLLVAR